MPAPQSLVQGVQAAVLASAHLAAFEHVVAAAQACQRLGSLTSGRWRSAARDLSVLEDDLQKAFAGAAEALAMHAETLGVAEDALWTVGDAAGTLDLLRDAALEEAFVEDPELADRGTTLLFGWPEALVPVTWPWQANWVVNDGTDNGEEHAADELDLFEAGELEGEALMLSELSDELACSQAEARIALRDAALALTRASLLAGMSDEDDLEDEDEEPNGEG
jgi:hypothetical protein